LLALAALIAALAQPRTDEQSAGGRRIVIMLDRSASMASNDGRPGSTDTSRLDAAKELAIEQVRALREPAVLDRAAADEAMAVACGAAAEISPPRPAGPRALTGARRAVTPAATPTSVEGAYRLAQAQRPARVLVEFNEGVENVVQLEGLKAG